MWISQMRKWAADYASVFPDSAAFHSQAAMDFFVDSVGVWVFRDCPLDTLIVLDLEIDPSGGIDRISGDKLITIVFETQGNGRIGRFRLYWTRKP